jgi:hypothetical protein
VPSDIHRMDVRPWVKVPLVHVRIWRSPCWARARSNGQGAPHRATSRSRPRSIVTASSSRSPKAEKALFDFAYLSSGRSRLFTSLPELDLPHGFRRKELARWVAKIPSERSRTLSVVTKSEGRWSARISGRGASEGQVGVVG